MEFKEVLFSRPLVKAYINAHDEEKSLLPEHLTVTKEQNGYALWYSAPKCYPPRIVAWGYAGQRDDVISLAARITTAYLHHALEEGIVIFKVDRLSDQAEEPVPESKAP